MFALYQSIMILTSSLKNCSAQVISNHESYEVDEGFISQNYTENRLKTALFGGGVCGVTNLWLSL